jgi:Ca2+/Na+ antiporter
MIQNIILITLLIFLIFLISNEPKINDLISKKYVKYLFLLLIIYFIYQNYNFTLLLIAFLIIIFLNIDKKIFKNKYLNIENYKDIFENFDSNSFDFIPFTHNKFETNIKEDKNNNIDKVDKVEPFKNEVLKLKDLYENIKLEIKKL